MTQLAKAKQNTITEEIKKASQNEPLSIDELKDNIVNGIVVIPKNINHDFDPVAVGKGTYIKVNANIGISNIKSTLENELLKLEAAVSAGAHSIMDLSVCNDLNHLRNIRKELIKKSPVMVGTVPIYEITCKVTSEKKDIFQINYKDILEVILKQAEDGVDFMTIHAGVTEEVIRKLNNDPRIGGIVSRGGSILAEWMKYNKKENPFFELYDDILDIAYEYDVTLSLGDGLRPGAIKDGTDRAQVQELIILGELVDRARAKNVQVMVEGPGHIKISDIEMNIKLQKSLCHNAPFYVLGPVVTDIAPGYDHITSAIGSTMAGISGADFLCYVTPGEHLYLPDIEDVHQGVIASRIAAHAADVALNKKGAEDFDNKMSIARKNLDWNKMSECAIDRKKVEDAVKKYDLLKTEKCTMCGEFCALKRNY
jgi:phosphomethylpyrimidine synthase